VLQDRPLLVIATGSSASIVLPDYLVELTTVVGPKLTVLLTHTAERFVRPEVVGWFAEEVLTSGTPGLNPVKLALTARAVVVLPASGNTLANAALGLMSTPATTALAASPTPCLFFPQMNRVIWQKRVMQGHVTELRESGHTVVEPEEQEAFEIWRQTLGLTLVMPGPDQVAVTVRDWLAEREKGPSRNEFVAEAREERENDAATIARSDDADGAAVA